MAAYSLWVCCFSLSWLNVVTSGARIPELQDSDGTVLLQTDLHLPTHTESKSDSVAARKPTVASVTMAGNLKEMETSSVKPPWTGPKIVGVGWKKTGTTSLTAACDLLGMWPNAEARMCRNAECMEYFASVSDFPTCCDHRLIATMKDLYAPDKVKFVLTERDTDSWRESVDAWMIEKPFQECWYSDLMNATVGTEEFYQKYEEHNAYVKDLFKDTPDRLLVLKLMEDDPVQNMQKLCRFIGVDDPSVCNQPFPRTNNLADHENSFHVETQESSEYVKAEPCSYWEKCSGCDYEGQLSGAECPCEY